MKKTLVRMLKSFGIKVMRFDKNKVEDPSIYAKNNNRDYHITTLAEDKNHIYFGYHDKIPVSGDGTKILACSVTESAGKKNQPDMQVGYFEKDETGNFSGRFNKIDKTSTWCWQQGCMLQWNPAQSNNEVIFNKIVNEDYGAVIYDLVKQETIREFNTPFYSVSPDGRIASSLNFSRLEKLRPGYGYKSISGSVDPKIIPKNDGVFLIDIASGKKKLIVSLSELADFTNKNAGHYINHITFSPSGKRLAFFHIYHDKSGEKVIRFYLYDLQKEKLTLLEASLTTSHYCWRNDDEILTTEMDSMVTNYYLYDLSDKTKNEISIDKIGDLHPMFNPSEDSIIVGDSKPDRKRNQHLFLFNIDSGKHEYIEVFHSPEVFSGKFRCDLHPRWDRNGDYVIVDTAKTGKREMALIDVRSAVNRLKNK